jgi:hypothetical protein
MEKETLEEAAVINYKKLYEGEPLTQDAPIDAFKDGAKWQAERMYSEEEKELMIKIFHTYWFENNPEHEDNLKEWELSKKLFEQFKKK